MRRAPSTWEAALQQPKSEKAAEVFLKPTARDQETKNYRNGLLQGLLHRNLDNNERAALHNDYNAKGRNSGYFNTQTKYAWHVRVPFQKFPTIRASTEVGWQIDLECQRCVRLKSKDPLSGLEETLGVPRGLARLE